MNDASIPDAVPPSRGPYDRDLLRTQMEILRRESAVRARLENEITAEHQTERSTAQVDADRNLKTTREKYTREIEATKKEYATLLQRVAAQAAADQKKLDEQRKAYAATIARTWEKQDRQLKEDDQFEESSYKEVFKEKRKDPVRRFMKAEKDLGRMAGEFDEADAASQKALAGWGVAVPTADDAAAAAEAPANADVLAVLEQLRTAIVEQAKALGGLKTARTAFAGGTMAAAVVLPVLLGLLAAAAAFFTVPGEQSTKLGAAGAAALLLAGGGTGLGLWLVRRMRTNARTQAAAVRSASPR